MTDRRVVSRERVVAAGMRHFLRHCTLDMAVLAGELAISRATLYRIAGSRDALLGEVLRGLTEIMLAKARGAHTRPGVDGVIEVSRHFGEQLRASTVMHQFLDRDSEVAARVLFIPSGPVHDTAIAIQRQIFADAGIAGDSADLAYLYVRLVGAFYYAEYFTGRRCDFEELVPALRSLLRPR